MISSFILIFRAIAVRLGGWLKKKKDLDELLIM